jgi:hypothetical protein
VIHANGYMCRESFSLGDRPENFYMIGSMGLASAIGLGFSLTNPDTPTVVLDGDGNLLMNLGILPWPRRNHPGASGFASRTRPMRPRAGREPSPRRCVWTGWPRRRDTGRWPR